MSRSFDLQKLVTRFSRFSLLGFLRLVVFTLILLFAQNVHSAEVTLAWDPNTEPDLDGYKIYFGSSSRTYDVSVDVGNQTLYTLSGLADGHTYFFAATAYDTHGNQSDYSEEVSWTSPSPNSPPVANDGSLTTIEDTLAGGTLSASDADGDALIYSLVSAGSLGTVTLADPATGDYIYTPNPNVTGTDTFSFMVNDGRVDSNVATVTVTITQPVDTDGDGIPDDDETDIYGTDPNNADTDGDGINDGDELAYWGDNWDADYDSDGLINLLDPDSDSDGFSDGEEINKGYDPSDPNSRPEYVKIWLEAEEGDLYTPMEIATDKEASSGEYIWVPNGWGSFSSPSEDAGYADYDSDGLINLLDPDSDSDGFSDGEEINKGYDPSDPNSRPEYVKIWLEAEEGDLYTPMEAHLAPEGTVLALPSA